MSGLPVANGLANGHPQPEKSSPANHTANHTSPPVTSPPKPARSKQQRPNYAKIHNKPLPTTAYPLPAFHPSHPLSLLRLAYVFLSQLLSPPSSHPENPYIGYWSPETRSVHVTDPAHVRALWEAGFFGKGTLSRSEPSWVEREKARVRAARGEGGTAEEATGRRREERRLFKLERARAERERIEVLLREEREGGDAAIDAHDVLPRAEAGAEEDVGVANDHVTAAPTQDLANAGRIPDADLVAGITEPGIETEPTRTPALDAKDAIPLDNQDDTAAGDEPVIDTNQEHLQLTLEEAFFLSYGLGILSIHPSPTPSTPSLSISNPALLTLFRTHSTFPPSTPSTLAPDDPFMLHYAAYHHFRSLGWVVRPGVKFGVDYLLYNRGPVFSHAEFAVLVLPAYTHAHWEGRGKEGRDWWWLHCVNRVQSQVRKTLVLAFVEVPPPKEGDGVDVGRLFRRYRVREFVVRRWLANRSRD